jgi:hypothetical protein
LPEAKDEPVIPKYFNMIRGSGYRKAEEERREILPGPMPRSDETPRAIYSRRTLKQQTPFPEPAPEPERVPLIIRILRRFISSLIVEPERPVRMPVVPELNYPALYTRFPMMKTVTKTTDAAGEIAVTFSHLFQTVPGVVITVKDPDNVFGTVFSTTLTGFEVRLFKMDHNHGGVVDDDGQHTPTINADGNHGHNVTGSISWTENSNYGRLVLSNYTDYETGHVHTQVQTQLETDHTHHVYPTVAGGAHTHSYSGWSDGPDGVDYALNGLTYGTACVSGSCVSGEHYAEFANEAHDHWVSGTTDGASPSTHTHTNITTGTGSDHRHLLNDTGTQPNPGHRHLISNNDLYDHYIHSITGVDISLLVTADESPYHAHSGNQIVKHGHGVAADGRVLLKNTNVTITYIAQEESS